jgi:hypothetical protein
MCFSDNLSSGALPIQDNYDWTHRQFLFRHLGSGWVRLPPFFLPVDPAMGQALAIARLALVTGLDMVGRVNDRQYDLLAWTRDQRPDESPAMAGPSGIRSALRQE